jgi:hypothetical protein
MAVLSTGLEVCASDAAVLSRMLIGLQQLCSSSCSSYRVAQAPSNGCRCEGAYSSVAFLVLSLY